MSGSQYHISYCQILESERRLQLSNILKLFQIKTQFIEKPTSLLEYLSTFFHSNDDEHAASFDVDSYLSALNEISLPEMATSQIECLAFVAGYAVFSYLKKSIFCRLSSHEPSSHVLECIKVIFDLFSKIDSHKVQFDNFYFGSSRTKLVQLACASMEELEHSTLWRFVWKCNV